MADAAITTECPTPDELKRLVANRCPEARAAELHEHIGGCPACQARLDRLPGDGPDVADHLRVAERERPPGDSQFWGAMREVERELTRTAVPPVPRGALPANGALAVTAAVAPTPASGDPSDDPPDLSFLAPPQRPGAIGRLGAFDILRVVGRGGMGVVLHGFDGSLNRDVAIKVIDPQLATNKQYRERFCREARAAASVSHDHLVAVHQVNEDDASGLPYLVMQLVNGESLDQRLKREGKMSPVEVARLGMQAAAGLAAAHAGGLTHRDIKPGNILMERSTDRIKLTDFGLAKAAQDTKLTRTGFVAGSPLYMAPEQARGEEVDHRADLFSLGTLLYEAATGRAPFDAGTPLAVLRRLSDETQMPLARVNPEMPKWLSDAVDKLLAKDPKDRYQSAREVAEVFAAGLVEMGALSPLDIPAEVCPAAYLKARSRKPICWKAVGHCVAPWAGGAVLGGLLVGLLWLLQPAPPPDGPAPVPGDAAVAKETGPAPRLVLQGEAGAVWSLAFISENRLAAGMEDGTVRLWNYHTGGLVRTHEPRLEGNVWAIDSSPADDYLVMACDSSRLPLFDLVRLRATGVSLEHPSSLRSAAFCPTGQFLATGDRASTVRVWDLKKQVPYELLGHRGAIHTLAYSPDGAKLASAGSDSTIKVWEVCKLDWKADQLVSRKPAMEMSDHRGPVYGAAFSPDNKKIASAGWDGTVRIWDVTDGAQLLKIEAHDGDVWAVSFGGDGKWVASAGSDGFVKVWDVGTGAEVFRYRGARGFHVVKFGPDGTTLAAGSRSGLVKVWDVK